eukprot:707770-Rhodomonas_salina.1
MQQPTFQFSSYWHPVDPGEQSEPSTLLMTKPVMISSSTCTSSQSKPQPEPTKSTANHQVSTATYSEAPPKWAANAHFADWHICSLYLLRLSALSTTASTQSSA